MNRNDDALDTATNGAPEQPGAEPVGVPAASVASTQRIALVTGATSGIGVEIARRLRDDGFTVVVSGRSEARGAAVAEALGPAVEFVRADLAAKGGPQELVEEVVRRHGHLDVLVNNAGIDHTVPFLEVPEHEIRETFELNTFAAMLCLQAAARAMHARGQGGAIINVTSRLAEIGVVTMGVYSASKGAMLAFTRAMAVELAPHDIRVNAVAPGMTRTPLYEEWVAAQPDPAATEAHVAGAIPLGRIATPQDVAGAVSYLASPAATYLTGVSIPVDGGYLAK
ncbi:NAD(P)-dependent dehydrogenase (short-subunit alcohol dehydrogenase family) [Pseudoclavibacter chungangensis]|uniref:SDR family NAD(P)-dependent oxidoreductase n=1 Tax=Pseudoclavibacter chungangensis TaxID=587635 RepID=UPI001794A67A|nr:SDR family oxidoreductase [Pseudoclavibacter chungangensis]NYJ65389.1 NAD(P)-dependent dehydrogenase (short-subunit alcohol dehydrogenase family) [Pseudoclavibacter chungangensis]